MATQERWHIN